MSGRRLTLFLALAVAAAVLVAAGPAAASTASADASINDPCFRCHGQPEAKKQTIEVGGVQKSIYVDRAKYEASSHGRLACTSCHIGFEPGPHTPEQTDGWLETAKLTACENCHADTFEMYRGSFHGDLVFGETTSQAPVCADCHAPHNIVPPESLEFRRSIDPLCARCHPDAAETYLNSFHGKAYYLGENETAVCTDCHGGHKILPPSDPESRVSEQNLVATCGECHPGANENFAGFLVHVDPQDPSSNFWVWTFYALYIALIAVVFTFGFVHTALYIYRGIRDGLYRRNRHG